MKRRKNQHAVKLGRRGGRAKTPKKRAASKRNARYAGRPRRVCVFCGGNAHGGHVDRRQDGRCNGNVWRWQQRDSPLTRATVEALIADLMQALSRLPPDDAADDDPDDVPPIGCPKYEPDANGECLNCDEPANAHQPAANAPAT